MKPTRLLPPTAWTTGDCSHRVIRGGAWDNGPKDLRTAVRGAANKQGRDTVGFRVARSLEEVPRWSASSWLALAIRPANASELALFSTSMRQACLAWRSNFRSSMAAHAFAMDRRCNPCARCAMLQRQGHGPKALRCNREGARSFVASIQMIGSRRSSAYCKIWGVPPRPWAGAPSHMVSTTSERLRVSNPAAT